MTQVSFLLKLGSEGALVLFSLKNAAKKGAAPVFEKHYWTAAYFF